MLISYILKNVPIWLRSYFKVQSDSHGLLLLSIAEYRCVRLFVSIFILLAPTTEEDLGFHRWCKPCLLLPKISDSITKLPLTTGSEIQVESISFIEYWL